MPETTMTAEEQKAYNEALRRIEECRQQKGMVLDLSQLGLTRLPPELGQLRSLWSLDLRGNQLREQPPELGQLQALERLDLVNNQLRELLPELGQLQSLRELHLTNNQLRELPSELGQLQSLWFLDLGGNQLRELPPELGQLQSLRELHLTNNQLRKLPLELGQLQSLWFLDLGGNQLRELPPELGQLQSLRELHLSYNQLRQLPSELGQLQALERLYLANNQLRELPPSLATVPKLAQLYLHCNPELGLPPEVLGPTWIEVLNKKTTPARPKDILDYYFARQTQGERPLNEVKLLLVGRGGAGKTSVVERLIRSTFNKQQESTLGIALQDWTLPCPGGDPVTVHVWDFAGQVIAHATHQFFLSARSVYVLVLTAREDSQREDAEYWLRLIRAFGSQDGETSKVIVALNKWQQAPVRLDREALREKYPFIIGFVETDCESGLGIPELRTRLAEVIGHDPVVRDKTGNAYFDVKDALRKRWHEQQTNHLDYTDFEKLCEAKGVADKGQQKSMAANLHRLGLALNYGDDPRLRDTTVLNPHWVTDGIYKLLREAPNERAELSIQAACHALPKEKAEKVMFLIRLMQKYDLVFPLKEDELLWLVPAALADSQPVLGDEWQGKATRLRWTYAALPEGLVPRFITRTHSLSEGQSRWLNGTLLELGHARAVVRADASDRRITAMVIGPEPDRQRLAGTIQTEMRDLNAEIKGLNPLEELQLSLAPEVWASVEGLENTEKRAAAKNREPVVEMLTPKGPLEVNATDENNRLTAEDARTDVWKPRVFISYSHKDDAAKDQLVLKLKVLQAAGLVDFWHDVDLAAGEEWNRRITDQLEQMDVFVLLVSDHSLVSPYIHRVEIKRALERRAEGTAEVVPVILHRCNWKACGLLNHLKVLPKDGKPIKDHKPQAVGWHEMSDALMRLFEGLKAKHANERRGRDKR